MIIIVFNCRTKIIAKIWVLFKNCLSPEQPPKTKTKNWQIITLGTIKVWLRLQLVMHNQKFTLTSLSR